MSENDSLYSRQSKLSLRHYNCVFVIGCGGVGNWVALDLALSGCVEDLYLVDPDIVEESNLNRTMFEYSDIKCNKVDCIATQIMKRRPNQRVFTICDYMTDDLVDNIIKTVFCNDNSYYHHDICVLDCRDDIYEDVFKLNCKLYKVGYDGVEISIDGNPRLTKVFGQRGGSYTVTPSYVCSSQLAAILVVNDLLYPKSSAMKDKGIISEEDLFKITTFTQGEDFGYLQQHQNGEYDEYGRLNDLVSFNCATIPFKYIDNPTNYSIPKPEQLSDTVEE